MRSLFVAALIAGAMGAAWAATNALQIKTPPDASLITASIEKPQPVVRSQLQVFTLSSANSTGSCMIVKGRTLSPGYAELKVNPACESISKGLTTARFWRERADGSIAFVDGDNAPLVEFYAGDGADFESYQPSTAKLSMWAE
ncbi:MAG: hypothetical protein KF874_10770 [Rhizobiaceae bacterium]|nr:hypothetical protein [Rhizobiaceae bacterium]